MLRLLGPEYRYAGEKITDEIIYIDDHHWNEETNSFPVEELLKTNPGNHLIVFDHHGHDDLLSTYPHVCLPVFISAETEQFIAQQIKPNWNNKHKVFNFMINKPRAHRIRLLELIDYYKLDSYAHSLAWKESPIKSIPVTNYKFGDESVMDQGVRNGSYKNSYTYQGLLQHTVFEPTCISLITEPCFYERESLITEKTLMAMYAGTLPIWVGGWRLPDVMRDLGFDVFDDVIDHSYSTLDDPWNRLDRAIELNQHLLTNINLSQEFIKNNLSRLQHNVDLIESNVFLDVVKQTITQYPKLKAIADMWQLTI